MNSTSRTPLIYVAAAALLALSLGAVVWSKNKNATPPPVDPPPTHPIATPTPTPPTPPATPTAPPQGNFKTGDTLALSGALSHPYIAQRPGKTTVYAQVDVDAIEAVNQANVPLDVAIVIDCSGSMKGDKITQARIAAQDFVMRLRTGDRATLIAYDSTARVELPMTPINEGTKRALQQAIGELHARGGTNISQALTEATRMLTSSGGGGIAWAGPGGPNMQHRVRRALLLSDGRATAGDTTPEALQRLAANLRAQGVSVSTLGLGTDYNELNMAAIADKSGGNYYFIQDATRLAETFTKEFATLQNSVARDVTLRFRPALGVTISAVHGFEHAMDNLGNVTVLPGEFWSKRNASLMLELQIDSGAVRTAPLVSAELAYTDLVTRTPKAHTGALSVAITQDTKRVDDQLNAAVIVRAEQLRTVKAREEALRRYERGDAQGARDLLIQSNSGLGNLRKELKAKGKDTAANAALFDALDAEAADSDKMNDFMGSNEAAAPASKVFLKKKRASSRAKRRSATK